VIKLIIVISKGTWNDEGNTQRIIIGNPWGKKELLILTIELDVIKIMKVI